MISKIIDKTEDSAVLRSAELYIDGVNQSIMRANLTDKIRPKECIIQEDGNLICDGEYEIKIEATGTKPSSGTLIIEDRAVKSFTDMILDIYKLEMNEEGKIVVIEKIEEEKDKTPEQEKLLNGATPNLYDNNLIPIMYSDNNWKVADTTAKWYDYANQEWANAVILKSEVTKNVGDTIDISSEVQGMFVWIPRYEYKIEGQYGTHTDGTIGTQEQPGEIKVNFISKDIKTASEGYNIHPAFTFGTTELNGIWVGKFKISGTASVPTILPNLKTITGQSVSSCFKISQVFNTYVNNLETIDAHMMKNSEWGAAAYLSQSKYGKYGNPNYTGTNKQVMLNNCSNYITGIGADSQDDIASEEVCTNNTYETLKGQAASTTGNITGIYDMSGGGGYEYVMGVYNKTKGSSGINFATLDPKYYDNYTTTDSTTACDNGICYGHALSETRGWYGNFFSNSSNSYPWTWRGGYFSVHYGVFSTYHWNGENFSVSTFRVVITES